MYCEHNVDLYAFMYIVHVSDVHVHVHVCALFFTRIGVLTNAA